MAMIATIASVAGGLFGAYQSIQQGKYQAAVANNNAIIAEQNAQKISDQSQLEQQEADAEQRAFAGQQLATQAASGLSTESRSSILTRRSAANLARIDASNIIAEGASRSRDQQQQAANFRGQAAAAKASGTMGAIGSIIGIGSSLVSGAQPLSKSYKARYGVNY